MLCYRCGSHIPDKRESCPTCGQRHEAASRPTAASPSRRGAESTPYKPGDVVALRYAVLGVLGSGPLGHVFKVQDRETKSEVSLKVVHPRLLQAPEERGQFSRALRAGRTPGHPHLLNVYEEGLDGEFPYFTAELLQGTTLRKVMEARAARGQRFSLAEVEPLLAALASALDAAHRTGPHADLKPENIFILPSAVKVTDRGLGLAIPRLPFIQAQKHARADCYLAPEFVAGGDFDGRADVYSLAVILGELLTGLTPTDGTPPRLEARGPELPAAFVGLYRRALNANPLARPRTAGDFFREYLAVLGRKPASSPAADASAEARSRAAPELSPSHAALVAAARGGEKPPPPVPTHQIPLSSLASAAPAVDATQPMDAQQLASLMGTPPAAAAPAVPAAPGARPRPAQPLRALQTATPTVPALPRAEKPPRPLPLLALLALAGVLTGSLIGYFVLRPPPRPAAPESSGTPAASPVKKSPTADTPL